MMSRPRFIARRPVLVGLIVLMVVVVAIDLATDRASAVEVMLLVVLVGWISESLFRSRVDAEARESDANARWALAGLMGTGETWPTMGGWALGPAAVTEWIRRVSAMETPQVVELGPGSSTLLLARAVPHARVHAVEHDPVYGDRIRAAATGWGLSGVTVVDAPLRATAEETAWYSGDSVSALPERVDALLVDGPPNWDGKGRRSPARRVIEERMPAGALVLVDDTDRPDERKMVRGWVRSGLCRVVQDSGNHVFLEKC
ncbi:class I SAM-dependent methyltransferase [Nocardioides euryhalodurans]|uniref:Class I SAM-dependent methyltransferase n=1 Tax=Nocardioides euryhalodurans TaxID=2518370 RepID=A0A4P7GN81_9ACTN|nr:class I SAM-dependent methyltransferase [Nocardioides euryhalodurans]QBR93389.1 hypothetical protein EXE57_14775 [Nocardioides euryhalodurans]